MGKEYHNLSSIIGMIDAPNYTPAQALYDDHKDRFHTAKGSATKHQAWQGGYVGHIEDICNMAIVTYEALNDRRQLPFTQSDVLLVLYLHDIEKPWKHQPKNSPFDNNPRFYTPDGKKNRNAIKAFSEKLIIDYGFILTDEHKNALNYVEGEIHDYHPTERKMGRLAAFCHAMDVLSARAFYDFPKNGW